MVDYKTVSSGGRDEIEILDLDARCLEKAWREGMSHRDNKASSFQEDKRCAKALRKKPTDV